MEPVYIVMFVCLAIWLGLFAYLWRLEARLKGIEGRLAAGTPARSIDAPMAVLETRAEAAKEG